MPPPSATSAPDPRLPTERTPGSPGKIAVLAERAALGLALFHPLDNAGPASRVPSAHAGARAGRDTAGVTRHFNRWKARVQLNGRQVYLGLFGTQAEARRAVEAAREAHLAAVG